MTVAELQQKYPEFNVKVGTPHDPTMKKISVEYKIDGEDYYNSWTSSSSNLLNRIDSDLAILKERISNGTFDMSLTHDLLIRNGFIYSEEKKEYRYGDYTLTEKEVAEANIDMVEFTLNHNNPKGPLDPPFRFK